MMAIKTGRTTVMVAVRTQVTKCPRIGLCRLAFEAISCPTPVKAPQFSATSWREEEHYRLSEAIEYP